MSKRLTYIAGGGERSRAGVDALKPMRKAGGIFVPLYNQCFYMLLPLPLSKSDLAAQYYLIEAQKLAVCRVKSEVLGFRAPTATALKILSLVSGLARF